MFSVGRVGGANNDYSLLIIDSYFLNKLINRFL